MSSVLINNGKFCGQVQIAALTMLGIIEAPEHATEMTHSRVKTTLTFLQRSTATVIDLRFFMKKMTKKMKKMKNLYVPVLHTYNTLIQFVACSYLFTCSLLRCP